MGSEYVTLKEAARRLEVSYLTAWQMVRDGQLPAVRVRSAIRIPLGALERLPSYKARDADE